MAERHSSPPPPNDPEDMSCSETEPEGSTSSSEEASGSKEKADSGVKMIIDSSKPEGASSSDSNQSASSASFSAVLPDKNTTLPGSQHFSLQSSQKSVFLPSCADSTGVQSSRKPTSFPTSFPSTSRSTASPKRARSDQPFAVFREIRRLSKAKSRSKQVRRIVRNFFVNYPLASRVRSQTIRSPVSETPGLQFPDMTSLKGDQAVAASEPVSRDPGASAYASEPVSRDPGASAYASEPVARDPGASAYSSEPVVRDPGASAYASEPVVRDPGASACASGCVLRDSGASASASGHFVRNWRSLREAASRTAISDVVNSLTGTWDEMQGLDDLVVATFLLDVEAPGPSSRYPVQDEESVLHRLAVNILNNLRRMRNILEGIRSWALGERATDDELKYYLNHLNNLQLSDDDSFAINELVRAWERSMGPVNKLGDSSLIIQLENRLHAIQKALVSQCHLLRYKYLADRKEDSSDTDQKEDSSD